MPLPLSLVPLLLLPLTTAHKFPSCIPIPHTDPQVTWQTTRCAFCFSNVSKANDTLWMNYNGTLLNGTLFDSSYTVEKPWPKGDPFNFTLGAGQVIKGFDAGLYGMCPEERRWLKIKPEFGYGAKGVPGVIPPNATLIFNVELMGIGTVAELSVLPLMV